MSDITPEHHRWNSDKGDKTHRLNYSLNENSIILDVGGFEGQWAEDMYRRYNCKIYIFEPVESYYKILTERFIGNDKVKIYKCGVSNKDGETYISLGGDSSSTFHENSRIDTYLDSNREKIQLIDLSKFLEDENLDKVDLIKINIEGGEFDLLEHLADTDKLKTFVDIQVQFHDFVPNAIERRDGIRESLSKTHYITYDYTFIWENWRLK